MAIVIEANYQKKCGLPGFSSHSYGVTVKTEVQDLSQVPEESTRLYNLLQSVVDEAVVECGFVPGHDYGMEDNGSTSASPTSNSGDNRWACSEAQKNLLLKLVAEHSLDKDAVEQTAQDRFGTGVTLLNKLQMSGLISEVLEICGKGRNNGGNGSRSRPRQPARKGGGR